MDQRKDSVRPDLPTLSIASLNTEYLKDPEALALADFKDRKRHLNWWTLKFGTIKVLDFGVIEGRAARDLLIPGSAPATVNRYIAAMRPHGTGDGAAASCRKTHLAAAAHAYRTRSAHAVSLG